MIEPSAPLDRSVESAPKVLVIDRSKWQRGDSAKYTAKTALLTNHGMMCCLGFDALACGLTEDQILYAGSPAEISGELPAAYRRKRLVLDDDELQNTAAVQRAIEVNDGPKITDAARERRLISILKQLGWDDVRFVDQDGR